MAVHESTREARLAVFLSTVRRGEIRTGVVVSIHNFGVFVTLDGDASGSHSGFIDCAGLSWRSFDHPSEIVEVGLRIRAEVLDVDFGRGQVKLSLKATVPDPWRRYAATVHVGEIVAGTVTKLVRIGAFVRVSDGIEGLIPCAEPADHAVTAPEELLSEGEEVRVAFAHIDFERRRLLLSLRQAQAALRATLGLHE
ncbi:S1 RNA-binding domain-containing protein [Yinghuangia seranimata]|uniref:S1 RNA-binding domain-containing protein n=1 Tax=Yinghuangia seranimata TaxID=408067 RepID=UPI00248AADC6|nr:S1 RNA-binding domain-containing protein [Yinghuangia seranimata]MDI2127600.1 S1 RNA-binding domain-containing protein [Yinghuangia seranimata]